MILTVRLRKVMRKRETCSKPFLLYWAWADEHGGGFNTPAHARATCGPVREAAKKTARVLEHAMNVVC